MLRTGNIMLNKYLQFHKFKRSDGGWLLSLESKGYGSSAFKPFWDRMFSAEVEAAWLSKHVGVSVSVGQYNSDCKDIQLSIGTYLFSIYFILNGVLPRSVINKKWFWQEGRELSLSIHHGSIWFNPWRGDDQIPYSFNPLDFILGDSVCTYQKIGAPLKTTLQFTHGDFSELSLQLEVRTWKRPRWYKVHERISWDIKCEKGIRTGDDKYGPWNDLYSWGVDIESCPDVHTLDQYIIQTVEDQREKHGFHISMLDD